VSNYVPRLHGDVARKVITELNGNDGGDRTLILVILTKTNSGALVRQQTIPTERPTLVGEISANFSR
jgi:hypothetical protein